MINLSKELMIDGDKEMAVEWLRRAKRKGLVSAQIILQNLEEEQERTQHSKGPSHDSQNIIGHLIKEMIETPISPKQEARKTNNNLFDLKMLSERAEKGSKTASSVIYFTSLF